MKRRWFGLKQNGNIVCVLSSRGEELTLQDFENEFPLPPGKFKVVEVIVREKK